MPDHGQPVTPALRLVPPPVCECVDICPEDGNPCPVCRHLDPYEDCPKLGDGSGATT